MDKAELSWRKPAVKLFLRAPAAHRHSQAHPARSVHESHPPHRITGIDNR